MANEHTDFWRALLAQAPDMDQRVRLWNGYLGWRLPASVKEARDPNSDHQQLIVDPPDGGWPTLTEEEQATLEGLTEEFEGHPEFKFGYMDFADQLFVGKTDLSGLILVHATFDRATFGDGVRLSDKTRFHAVVSFGDARFEGDFFSDRTLFDAEVSFAEA